MNAFAVNYILNYAITRNADGKAVADSLFTWYGHMIGAVSPEATEACVTTIAMVHYAIACAMERTAVCLARSATRLRGVILQRFINHERPHRSLGLQTPSPFAKNLAEEGSGFRQATPAMHRNLDEIDKTKPPETVSSKVE